MLRSSVSWGVLLFSLAIIAFGHIPQEDGFGFSFNWQYHVPVITLPILGYRIFGAIAVAVSLFLVISAFWRKWSCHVEKFVTKKVHYLLFGIYWIVYIIGYFKGVAAVASISPPVWVVGFVFYAGFLLFLLIPALYVKFLFERKSKRRHPAPKPK